MLQNKFFISILILFLKNDSDLYQVKYRYTNPELFPKVDFNDINNVTVGDILVGRMLFYDPILSKDSSISCSSCHIQANSFGKIGRHGYDIDPKIKFSKNDILPLFNLVWKDHFFWDGSSNKLENQIWSPIHNNQEMNSNWNLINTRLKRSKIYRQLFKLTFSKFEIDSFEFANSISNFERTLISANSKFDKFLNNQLELNDTEIDGLEIFCNPSKGNCLSCHELIPQKKITFQFLTTKKNKKVIFHISNSKNSFKKNLQLFNSIQPPSLRNISFTGPYMHDGKFVALDYAINHMHDETKDKSKSVYKLNSSEISKVVNFLVTLNDTIFIKDTSFSTPFRQRH